MISKKFSRILIRWQPDPSLRSCRVVLTASSKFCKISEALTAFALASLKGSRHSPIKGFALLVRQLVLFRLSRIAAWVVSRSMALPLQTVAVFTITSSAKPWCYAFRQLSKATIPQNWPSTKIGTAYQAFKPITACPLRNGSGIC